MLKENRDILELMKDALMEYETIDADQIDDIMLGKKPGPPRDWSSSDTPDKTKTMSDDKDSNASKAGKKEVDKSGKIGGPASEH